MCRYDLLCLQDPEKINILRYRHISSVGRRFQNLQTLMRSGQLAMSNRLDPHGHETDIKALSTRFIQIQDIQADC